MGVPVIKVQDKRRKTTRKLLLDAEYLLSVFEGALSSCRDRGALPDKVFAALDKQSKSVRKRIRRRLATFNNKGKTWQKDSNGI